MNRLTAMDNKEIKWRIIFSKLYPSSADGTHSSIFDFLRLGIHNKRSKSKILNTINYLK